MANYRTNCTLITRRKIMTLLKQIKLDLKNLRYYFFDFPKLSNEVIEEINQLIKIRLHRPDPIYQLKWEASRWKIATNLDCDCLLGYNKKMIISVLVKPKFGAHISESHNGIWCPRCKTLNIKKNQDID